MPTTAPPRRRSGTTACRTRPALVRDFVKWDDQPASLQHFAESTVRAYKIAMTAPMEPVMIIADIDLQEDAIEHEAEVADSGACR